VWFGGGRLSRWTGRVEHVGFGRPLDALPPHPVPLDFVSGCVLALAPEARRAVGAWDERYFMYYEDVDYSVRARRAGVRLGLVREARAVHDEGGSSAGAGERSPLYYRYQARNRLLFAALHLARWRAVASTPYVLARSAATIVRHEPRRVSKLAAAARGSLDGLRLALRAR
jgi:GT2 family glycosyltransferase